MKSKNSQKFQKIETLFSFLKKYFHKINNHKITSLLKKIFPIFKYRPIESNYLEMLLQRALISILVWKFHWKNVTYTSQNHPNGLAHFFDLTFISNPDIYSTLTAILFITLILWSLNIFSYLSLTYITSVLIINGTLYNSQGEMHHNIQIISIIFLSMLIGYTIRYFKEKNKVKNLLWASNSMQVKGIDLALQGIAATYIIAGIWKLHISGIGWIIDIPNISLQCVKTGMQGYLNYLDISFKERGFEMAEKIIKNPNFFRFLMGLGLLAELLAFILLLNRPLRFIMGISLLIMHISITYYMQLNFFIHKFILFTLVINVPFLISYPLTTLYNTLYKKIIIKKKT